MNVESYLFKVQDNKGILRLLLLMKNCDTHFDDYLYNETNVSLHPKLCKIYDSFPDDIKNLRNIIFYGPKGVGKYTQMLRAIAKYSPANLKYDRKIVHDSAKLSYIIKISDIHFEIDMSLLGCNSKNLWNEIYNHVVDVIMSRQNNTGIIVCKYFHDIHSELLECFYCYMKSHYNNPLDIKFILITEELSFIPDCIVETCKVIRVARPSRVQYNKCLTIKIHKEIKLNEITNMKSLDISCAPLNNYKLLCSDILVMITNPDTLNYNDLRDRLYDLLIYNLDITDCMWHILSITINENLLKEQDVAHTMLHTYRCIQYYNNNYRPIYHLESFTFYLINTIHGYANCV